MGTLLRTNDLHLTAPGAVRAPRRTAAALALLCLATGAAACGTAPVDTRPGAFTPAPPAPPLPDAGGWGVHVLTIRGAPDGATWVGTFGRGMFMLPPTTGTWQSVSTTSPDGISSDFVNSIAFETDTAVIWYGTVGRGFGRSADGGRTWRNWTAGELGPKWQYVAPHGIVSRGDTVFIATGDGLRITSDGGASWRCIEAPTATGATAAAAGAASDGGCTERVESLPNRYLLALEVAPDGSIYVGHLRGVSISRDRGRTWSDAAADGLSRRRVRSVSVTADSSIWALTESGLFADPAVSGAFQPITIRVPGYAVPPGSPRTIIAQPGLLPPLIATSYGMLALTSSGDFRLYYLGAADRFRPAGDIWAAAWWGPPVFPLGGSAAGLNRVLAGEIPFDGVYTLAPRAEPQAARHLWFDRPVADADGNPFANGSYLYGSTMGNTLPEQQGIDFNNPGGTPVRAAGDGEVVHAGPAAAGELAVTIRHDQQLEGQQVYTSYVHNSEVDVQVGQRVRAGEVIARVGRSGQATREHLRFEVYVESGAEPVAVNPQLWLRPLPGTGVVAGRVLDRAGNPLPGSPVHGLVLPYPTETPFSFAQTYGQHGRGSPAYGEHFAVGDVPAGSYTLGVMIDGQRVWRNIRVAAGQLTWVEFSP